MNDSHNTQLSATCLLLSVAEADENLEKKELETIQDILKDFFSITNNIALNLIHEAQDKMLNSYGLFEFGQHLNIAFNNSDKLDFITCVFEVAFSDGDLHYLEHHTVKKIANILNINQEDIISSKTNIKKFME